MRSFHSVIVFVYFILLAVGRCQAQEPNSWIDSETNRQVIKISAEPYATLPYFTANAISADGQFLVYISAQGLHVVDLSTFTTRLLVPSRGAEVQVIEFGRRTNRLFYLSKRHNETDVALKSIDVNSGKATEHARVPQGYRIESINAEERLAAGVREDAPRPLPKAGAPTPTKGEVLYARVNEKIPMTLFAVDLTTGVMRDIHQSTDWLSHPQFSPTDPDLLMYSHEGPWHQVDRIWTIRVDERTPRLVHRRTANMEIAGHEFWSRDGATIHYDWQRPKGEAFHLASYDVASGTFHAAALAPSQWSIRFNASTDGRLFAGDGADSNQVSRSSTSAGIFLYRLSHGSTQQSVLTGEKLIDMRRHDYSLEPNARLTPDNRWVVFRSNMFGAPAVFAVSVDKAGGNSLPVRSTAELAKTRQEERRRILMLNP